MDDWLLANEPDPVLRIYEWDGPWLSIGYFGEIAVARQCIQAEPVGIVRRATGGGLVDHRSDRTYSLVVPRGEPFSQERGSESYRRIHAALAGALESCGYEALLVERDAADESPLCFERPVTWDLVDGSRRKVAGAGQRRTRRGLLHQGSVLLPACAPGVFDRLARRLAVRVTEVRREPSQEDLAALVERFRSASWTERR